MAGWRNRTRHVRQRTEQRLDKKKFEYLIGPAHALLWVSEPAYCDHRTAAQPGCGFMYTHK
jgi:hypothetical protein